MSGVEIRLVGDDEDGLRVDRWFKSHYPALGHGHLEKLLRTGQIRIDGARAKSRTRLRPGQKVRVPPLSAEAAGDAKPARPRPVSPADAAFIESLVIHRDGDLIALNKPPGLAVQGGSRTARHIDALASALAGEGRDKPRLVHRLDKATSGVLLLARSRKAAAEIGRALKAREAEKIYWALVIGAPSPADGVIDLPLTKAGGPGRERVAPAQGAAMARGAGASARVKSAVTWYRTIETAGHKLAWLALAPLTGRTHQLRVHLAAIGHPIVGDLKYGGAAARASGFEPGLYLHARSIAVPRPGGAALAVTAPLPPHMRRVWRALGFGDAPEDPFAEAAL